MSDQPLQPGQGFPDWDRWLARDRQGGDSDHGRAIRTQVAGYVDRVMAMARLEPGMTLLDAGTGDGVLALRAIEQVGPELDVILVDQSQDLLDRARAEAEARGVQGQCRMACLPLEDLGAIASASVDVIATRSALAYVADKRAVFRAFLRILKPGGRIALGEPVFQDEGFDASLLARRFESEAARTQDRAGYLIQRWKSAQWPDSMEKIAASPLTNYSERDLLRMALGAGFVDARLELEILTGPTRIPSWEVLLETSPHPWARTLRTLLDEDFSVDEAHELETLMRARLASGQMIEFDRMAYLSARKPIPG